jgi:hypothetical protein
LPSRTTRAGSGVAPNRASWSRQAQWQAARLPLQQPGRAQQQRAGADRGHVARPGRQPAQLVEEGLVGHRLGRAEAAGHAQQVAVLDIGQPRHAGEHQALGLDLAARLAGDHHLGAGQAAEDLVRPGEVQVGDIGEQGEHDVERRGVWAWARPPVDAAASPA